jgi:hypothetical protein
VTTISNVYSHESVKSGFHSNFQVVSSIEIKSGLHNKEKDNLSNSKSLAETIKLHFSHSLIFLSFIHDKSVITARLSVNSISPIFLTVPFSILEIIEPGNSHLITSSNNSLVISPSTNFSKIFSLTLQSFTFSIIFDVINTQVVSHENKDISSDT